jgi:oligopeptide/dipeptide ABC transporter ATP-binding protein
MSGPALSVRGLSVSVALGAERVLAVDDLSFEVEAGGSLGIVGESGSGKTLTLRALMGLLPAAGRVEGGSLTLAGEALPWRGAAARRARRGRLGMVFQDPQSALDPVQTVGAQVAEVPRRILGLSRRRAHERATELLALVGIPDPAARAHAFPHQLSGGLRQRVAIAIAIAADPAVLLCDEPTTALDVTVQTQILALIDDLRSRLGLAVVFVSHDLAVVREVCSELGVMYAGRLVEQGETGRVLEHPAHPNTLGLRGAVVDLDEPLGPPRAIPGALPELGRLPAGCAFHPRCPFASPVCLETRPALRELPPGLGPGVAACFHSELLGRRSA